MNVNMLIKEQKKFFQKGSTRNLKFRKHQLNKLKFWIIQNERLIFKALQNDLNKPAFEAYAMEVGLVLGEIEHALKNLGNWSRRRRVNTPLMHFPSVSYVCPEPYGVVLIMSPWNYPFLLTITPLIGAIAAGNCVILKPSEYSVHTSSLIAKMTEELFTDAYITTVEGDKDISQRLLCEKFDYIFFTGSGDTGREVMKRAAQHLTPVTLELGGKSPCIVDESADIPMSAKRIVWGKFINAGQTCVAPDYVLVHHSVKQELVRYMIYYIKKFYGKNPCSNPNYPKIINERHYYRLLRLMEDGRITAGGSSDKQSLRIEPTLIDNIDWDCPVMKDEIFGPILPIIEYTSLRETVDRLRTRKKSLALYFFGKDRKREQYVLRNLSFGGGCINDTLVHLASPSLPFGGVGESGMGEYHGKAGFDTFSHRKSILKKSLKIDMPYRYPPYRYSLELLKRMM